MKFRVTLKDPDGFYDGITDAVEESLKGITFSALSEYWSLKYKRYDSVSVELKKWVNSGEYITIEFDTTAGTATVVPLR